MICVSIGAALLLMILWTNVFGVKNDLALWISMYYIIFSIHVLHVFAPTDIPELLPRLWLNCLFFCVVYFWAPTYDRRLELLLWDVAGLLVSDGEDFLCCVMYWYFQPNQYVAFCIESIFVFLCFFKCEWISTVTLWKNILIHSLTFLYLFVGIVHDLLHVSKQNFTFERVVLGLLTLVHTAKLYFFKHIFSLHRFYIPELLL